MAQGIAPEGASERPTREVDAFDAAVLTDDECWGLLAGAEVCRLAVVVAGRPEIYPVNTVVDDRRLVFRTEAGTKLASLTVSPHVALEADGVDAATGEVWSVVVTGDAARLERFDDIYAADALPLYPWQPGPKTYAVSVTPTTVSGRRFRPVRGPRPED